MKRLLPVLIVLALIAGGLYVYMFRTGDWVVTVSGPGGETYGCYKMTETTLTRNPFQGTVSWQLGPKQLTLPASTVHATAVVGGRWDAAFAMAGVDGDLCTNGVYPDPLVAAKKAAEAAMKAAADAARDAAERARQAMPQIQQQAQDAAQKAANGLRDIFNR